MRRKAASRYASPSDLLAHKAADGVRAHVPMQAAMERMIAVGYGLLYDAVVRGFRPYQALLDELVWLVDRSRAGERADTAVLDISCGIGTVAARLAREGYSVTGVDAVRHLVGVARSHHADSGLSVSFHHADIARDMVPGAGKFDVLISMHTLYWHPDPQALLVACRRALKPGGKAIILTYSRPARVWRTLAEVRARRGLREAVRALRWLVPTALFEMGRRVDRRYLGSDEFQRVLTDAGFEVLETRATFLAGMSLLAWARAKSS